MYELSQNENRVDANVKSLEKKLCEQSKLIPTTTTETEIIDSSGTRRV